MGNGARSNAAALADPAGLTVRPATQADLPEVCALERVSYSDPWPASAFATLPPNPNVFFAIARDGGQLLGYVVGWHVVDEGELANLAVDRLARKQGVGRRLLNAMLADAAVRGTKRVFLEVRESNVAARRLYATAGFEEVGRRTKYYRSPVEDALILRRMITG